MVPVFKKLVVVAILSTLKAGVEAELADYDLLGSCTFNGQWTGPTCMEFRGEGWDSTTMTERCAKENDSTLVEEEGCTTPPDTELAGWCISTVDGGDETSSTTTTTTAMIEASPMMISAMAECSGNKMACETFVGGTWEAATNCETGTDSAVDDNEVEAAADSSSSSSTGNDSDGVITISEWLLPYTGPETVVAYVGDTITFEWDAGHNVYIHPTNDCTLEGAIYVGDTSPTQYTFTQADLESSSSNGADDGTTGTEMFFSCDIGDGAHCKYGQYLIATVFPSRDGDNSDSSIDSDGVEAEAEEDLATTTTTKTTVLIESFDEPKFMWETFSMDDAKMNDMKGMQDQYDFDFSGYDNDMKDNTEYTEWQDGSNWNNSTTTGSSMDIVDGIMILTANISGVGIGNTVTMMAGGKFPDLSTCDGLQFEVMTTRLGNRNSTIDKEEEEEEEEEYDYNGFMVDFGYKKLPDKVFGYGYRANILVPISNNDATTTTDNNESSSDTNSVSISTTRQQDINGQQQQQQQQAFVNVNIPFDEFSLDYDYITGKQVISCMEDATLCPDEITLQNLETMTITAIGNTNGVVQLHIKSIHGIGCDAIDTTDDMDNSKEMNNNDQRQDQLTCSSDSATPDEIILESFSNPSYDWGTQNDPVMGGESYSSMEMIETDGTAYFTGEIKDVPFLGVPGFIKTSSSGMEPYPDVSCCDSLKLTVMGMEEYDGYRVSFGTARAKTGFFASGFKGDFDAPIGEYGDVVIPFNMFSVEWDEATGDQKITCAEDPDVCPDMKTLEDMETIAIWGEGALGKINLYVKSVSAVGCSSSSAASSKDSDIGGDVATSSAPVSSSGDDAETSSLATPSSSSSSGKKSGSSKRSSLVTTMMMGIVAITSISSMLL